MTRASTTTSLSALAPFLWGLDGQNLQRGRVAGASESYLLTPGRRPVYLPSRSLHLARSALVSFGGTRKFTTSVMAHLYAGVALRTPMRFTLNEFSIPQLPEGQRLAEHIAELLNLAEEPHLLIRPGFRPNSGAYVVIGIFDEQGRPLSFGKLDAYWGGGASAAAREAHALVGVESAKPPFIAPRVLAFSKWHGADLMLTTTLPSTVRRARLSAFQLSRLANQVAESSRRVEAPLADSEFFRDLFIEIARAARSQPEAAEILSDCIQLIDANQVLAMGRSHGDLAPWNVGRSRDAAVLWDWESSRPSLPIGVDLVHWHFQIGLARSDHTFGVREAMDRSMRFASENHTVKQRRVVIGSYLADHLARRMNEGHLVGRQSLEAARLLRSKLSGGDFSR